MGDELFSSLAGKHVLEAGCGAGRFTEVLLKAGAYVTSIDLSSAVEANGIEAKSFGGDPNSAAVILDAVKAVVRIPVMVMVQPPVYFQPNDLILGPRADASTGATGQVLASVREDLDPKTVVVSSDAAAFSVRVDPPGERAFRLVVDWVEKGKDSPTETKIHVRAGGETVDLPVRVLRNKTEKTP
jgi:SAM-dependent methyltransferase